MAAKSAHNSLKRSRILYAVNPQSTFLPSVDPSILSASIARRKRRVKPQQQQQQQHANSGSNALALISNDTTSNTNNAAGSTALISATGANNTANNAATGILVVRFSGSLFLSHPYVMTLSSAFFYVISFCVLFFRCFLLEIQIHFQSQNPLSHVARSLEIVYRLVFPFGLGSQHCHGSYQRHVCHRFRRSHY
jgi:hypothetical protein